MYTKKQVRSAFRSIVMERDGYRCAMCGVAGRDRQGGNGHVRHHPNIVENELQLLDAHHITDRNQMPYGGYVKENGITLCDERCHRLAEVFHQTVTPHPGYSPDELYARIGSTFEEAVMASQEARQS